MEPLDLFKASIDLFITYILFCISRNNDGYKQQSAAPGVEPISATYTSVTGRDSSESDKRRTATALPKAKLTMVRTITLLQAHNSLLTNRRSRRSVIIVAASFTIVFTCCGLNFAFGVYQALYDEMARQTNTPFTGASAAQIDLIGTISISLMTIGAPFSVAWAKRFSPRLISFVGGCIFSMSLILASFGTKLWHFHLTQGVLLGVGTCMPYMAAVTVAPTWFSSRRGLAMGIILAGTGVGGLVWAPALGALIKAVGFRNSLRLAGSLSFGLMAASSAALILSWFLEASTTEISSPGIT